MTSPAPASIGFLGFGLIGGSIARALTTRSTVDGGAGARPILTAWTPSGLGPAAALADGVIDRVAGRPEDAIDGADLVIIAAPPLETVALIQRLGGDLRGSLASGALVTDVASTKGAVLAAAAAAGLRFVGGHPMAGRESTGYAASRPDLFVDRPWVMVASGGAPAGLGAPVAWLAEACGAHPLQLSAADHDAAVAAISHVPLIAAAALVESVAGSGLPIWPLAERLAASGWASSTRLARGDPRMGAGIAATNAPAIAEVLRLYRAAISSWLEALERGPALDADTFEVRLEEARSRLTRPEPCP